MRSQTTDSPFPDYVEIAALALIVALGVPLNLYTLRRQLISYGAVKGRRGEDAKLGFLMLKINLNVADAALCILCIVQVGLEAKSGPANWLGS